MRRFYAGTRLVALASLVSFAGCSHLTHLDLKQFPEVKERGGRMSESEAITILQCHHPRAKSPTSGGRHVVDTNGITVFWHSKTPPSDLYEVKRSGEVVEPRSMDVVTRRYESVTDDRRTTLSTGIGASVEPGSFSSGQYHVPFNSLQEIEYSISAEEIFLFVGTYKFGETIRRDVRAGKGAKTSSLSYYFDSENKEQEFRDVLAALYRLCPNLQVGQN